MLIQVSNAQRRCGPEGLERAPADAHDAGCLVLEMSASGADSVSAKRRGDVGLKGLSEQPLMLMMLAQQSAGEMWARRA